MKTDILYYRRCVYYYFESEFSDFTVDEIIEKLPALEGESARKYWKKKVREVIRVYYASDKHYTETAGFLASLFRPRLKKLLKN
jgi:hypothetical protein